MSDAEWKLGKIESTHLGFEDHGILTCYLHLLYADPESKLGSTGQGFGGRVLAGEYTDTTLRGILNAVGVTSWEKLPGRMVWAYQSWDGVHRIRGVDTGKEFDPKQEAEA